MVRVELIVVLAIGLTSLTGGSGTAEERSLGWEIFAEPESPRDTTFDLESTSSPAKYSLDELVEPGISDPDVYIRFTPGEKGAVSEIAPPEGSPQAIPPSEAAGPSEFSPPSISLPPASDVTPLQEIQVEVPIIRTYPEYRRALEARTPVIVFEGKRWVYSEAEHRYVDPQQALLDEARQAQENVEAWSTEYVASEAPTGWDAFGIPDQDPYAELDQDPWIEYLAPADSYYSSTAREGASSNRGQKRAFRDTGVPPYQETGSTAQGIPPNDEGDQRRSGQKRAKYPGSSAPPTTTWGSR